MKTADASRLGCILTDSRKEPDGSKVATTHASLLDIVDKGGAKHLALVDPISGRKLTYAQVKEEIERGRQAFQNAGVKQGSVVLFLVPNSIEMVVSLFALDSLGAVTLLANPETSTEELMYYKEHAQPCLLVHATENQEIIEHANALGMPVGKLADGEHSQFQLPRVSPVPAQDEFQGITLMLYTSGTTNRPKGVPLTISNILASCESYSKAFALADTDVSYVPMPLFHVHGLLGGTLSALFAGGAAVIPPRFSASRFWKDVETYGITWYSASPTIHRILLSRADDDEAPTGKLRFIRSSSARLEAETAVAMEKRFGTVVLECYGMTEAANQVCANPLPPGRRKHNTLGLQAGGEVAILTDDGLTRDRTVEGEICLRGPSVMRGYYRNPEATAAAFVEGWFRTGDQGYLDPDGYLCMSGRIKELINRGGEKISPLEVDVVLMGHPAVYEAAAFAVTDAKYGEDVHAAVVLKEPVSEKGLIEFCEEHLAPFKVPKKIYFVNKLPRTSTNKVQRNLLSLLLSPDE